MPTAGCDDIVSYPATIPEEVIWPRAWCPRPSLGSEKSKLHTFGCALVGVRIGKKVAVGIERHLDGRVAHELLYLLRVMTLLNPQGSAGVA